jgi:fructokinase
VTLQIGVDLGGTKIEAIALAADSSEASRRRIATPRAYAPTLDAITALVTDLESESGAKATVGIGIPGVVSRATGLVKNANSTWLIGHPLQADLEPPQPTVASPATPTALPLEAVDGAGQAATPSSASSSAPASAAGSRSAGRFTTAPTRSPANGATTRFPG